ncbi:MAG: hypothetical protein ACOX45_10190 [Acutalibacteraceae bacterium]
MLPELTADSVRESLETGTFFAGSRCLKNSKELSEISMATGLDLGTDWRADSGIIQPEVTEITVNDEENTITIEADNALVIRWIANGNLIAYGNTIDLDMYLGQIDSYVRAEVFGEGGILYTQPFILEYDSSPEADIGLFYDFGNLIALFRSNVFKILAKYARLFNSMESFNGERNSELKNLKEKQAGKSSHLFFWCAEYGINLTGGSPERRYS